MNPQAAPMTSGAPQFGEYSDWANQQIAQGFTPEQLQQTLAENNITPASAQAPQPTAATGGPEPSWWEKLLPAAGGILGGIAGGAVSGGVGSIGGASAGGALGQALENKLTGKKSWQGNVATSGIQNGVGEVIGLGAGKVLGGLGEGIASAGGRATAKAAEEAAAKTATKEAIDEAAATKLNYGGIGKKMQSNLKLGTNQEYLKTLGLDHTDPRIMKQVSEAGLDLNNVVEGALGQSKPIDMSGFGNDVYKSAKQAGIEDLTISPMGKALSAAGLPADGNLPVNMDALSVRKLQQSIGEQMGNLTTNISKAENAGVDVTAMESQLKSLGDTYENLENKLYVKNPEVSQAIKEVHISPDEQQALAEKYGNQKLAADIADTVNNAKSGKDLKTPMQMFKRMDTASRIALDDIKNVTGTDQALQRAKFAANGGIATPKGVAAIGGSAGDAAAAIASATGHPAGMLASMANRAHKAGLTPKIAEGIGNIMTRTAPLIPPAAVLGSNLPNIASNSASAIPLTNEPMEGQGMNPQMPGAPMNPQNQLFETLLRQEQLAPNILGTSFAPVLASLAPNVQKNTMAANAVSGLEPTFANAGGPQGTGGGLLARLTGMIPGTPANTYQRQQAAAAAQLAAVLGISPEAAMAMLPQLTQAPQTAIPQQMGASSLLGSLTSGLPMAQ
jgi:hypothetical protein